MKIDYIDNWLHGYCWTKQGTSLIARFMGPTWGPSGADRTKVGPMLGPWTWLLGIFLQYDLHWVFFIDLKIWPVFIEASTALSVWVMTNAKQRDLIEVPWACWPIQLPVLSDRHQVAQMIEISDRMTWSMVSYIFHQLLQILNTRYNIFNNLRTALEIMYCLWRKKSFTCLLKQGVGSIIV